MSSDSNPGCNRRRIRRFWSHGVFLRRRRDQSPCSSGAQYDAGRKVLPEQALPGDLIFYGQNGDQSVALFLGNGQMLEAGDPVVTVSPVRINNMTPYLVRVIA